MMSNISQGVLSLLGHIPWKEGLQKDHINSRLGKDYSFKVCQLTLSRTNLCIPLDKDNL